MVMGDPQFWAASGFAHSLRNYARAEHLSWYVASMLPITYEWPGASHKKTVAPDVLVAFVPERVRYSYDLTAEGVFPAFVMEVVSPSSVERDVVDKHQIYTLLGAREYVLFRPDTDGVPLQGYRRTAQQTLELYAPEADGRLWSEVLGLHLVADGMMVRAVTPAGQPLLTPEQAEAELARLRAELQQYRDSDRQ